MTFTRLGAKTPGGAIAFAILFGFFSGGYVSLLSPVFISMSKNVAEFGCIPYPSPAPAMFI